MKQKINKWNNWLHQNLFWVVATFAFLFAVTISLLIYNTWLGDYQREQIKANTEVLSLEQEKAVEEAQQLRELLRK